MYDGQHVCHDWNDRVFYCLAHGCVAYDHRVPSLNGGDYDDVCVPYKSFIASKVELPVSNELHNCGNDLYNFCFAALFHKEINKTTAINQI